MIRYTTRANRYATSMIRYTTRANRYAASMIRYAAPATRYATPGIRYSASSIDLTDSATARRSATSVPVCLNLGATLHG